jgi:hypothetical protein
MHVPLGGGGTCCHSALGRLLQDTQGARVPGRAADEQQARPLLRGFRHNDGSRAGLRDNGRVRADLKRSRPAADLLSSHF